MSSEEEPVGETSGPSWTLIGAVLVVGVVVAMGVILSIQGLRSDDDRPVASSPSSSSQAPTTGSTESVCGLRGHEKSGRLTKAPDATWSLIEGFAVPSSRVAGPGEVDDDGFRYCYARTPEGAALSAANFIGVGSKGGPERESKILEHLVAPGPGRETLEKRASSSPVAEDDGTASSNPDTRIQIAGLRMSSYTDSEANLEILMRANNGSYVAQQFELRWAEGDWRVAFGDDGTALSEPRSVADATGFLPWSGA